MSSPDLPSVTEYRFSQAMTLRLMGSFLAVLGVAVFLLTAAVGIFALPILVLLVGVVVALLALTGTGYLLTRRGWVVRLDEAGYRVRFVRGVGQAQGRWKDVEDAVVATVAGEPCVVLRLRDGRTSTIPVRTLGVDPDGFVSDLRAHLDRGHGYKRLR
ncbi:MAG: hypothetical protein Q8Q02_02995 [Nocardioides sp.]|nr:hypothetical protein [Nocardioides sp.]